MVVVPLAVRIDGLLSLVGGAPDAPELADDLVWLGRDAVDLSFVLRFATTSGDSVKWSFLMVTVADLPEPEPDDDDDDPPLERLSQSSSSPSPPSSDSGSSSKLKIVLKLRPTLGDSLMIFVSSSSALEPVAVSSVPGVVV